MVEELAKTLNVHTTVELSRVFNKGLENVSSYDVAPLSAFVNMLKVNYIHKPEVFRMVLLVMYDYPHHGYETGARDRTQRYLRILLEEQPDLADCAISLLPSLPQRQNINKPDVPSKKKKRKKDKHPQKSLSLNIAEPATNDQLSMATQSCELGMPSLTESHASATKVDISAIEPEVVASIRQPSATENVLDVMGTLPSTTSAYVPCTSVSSAIMVHDFPCIMHSSVKQTQSSVAEIQPLVSGTSISINGNQCLVATAQASISRTQHVSSPSTTISIVSTTVSIPQQQTLCNHDETKCHHSPELDGMLISSSLSKSQNQSDLFSSHSKRKESVRMTLPKSNVIGFTHPLPKKPAIQPNTISVTTAPDGSSLYHTFKFPMNSVSRSHPINLEHQPNSTPTTFSLGPASLPTSSGVSISSHVPSHACISSFHAQPLNAHIWTTLAVTSPAAVSLQIQAPTTVLQHSQRSCIFEELPRSMPIQYNPNSNASKASESSPLSKANLAMLLVQAPVMSSDLLGPPRYLLQTHDANLSNMNIRQWPSSATQMPPAQPQPQHTNQAVIADAVFSPHFQITTPIQQALPTFPCVDQIVAKSPTPGIVPSISPSMPLQQQRTRLAPVSVTPCPDAVTCMTTYKQRPITTFPYKQHIVFANGQSQQIMYYGGERVDTTEHYSSPLSVSHSPPAESMSTLKPIQTEALNLSFKEKEEYDMNASPLEHLERFVRPTPYNHGQINTNLSNIAKREFNVGHTWKNQMPQSYNVGAHTAMLLAENQKKRSSKSQSARSKPPSSPRIVSSGFIPPKSKTFADKKSGKIKCYSDDPEKAISQVEANLILPRPGSKSVNGTSQPKYKDEPFSVTQHLIKPPVVPNIMPPWMADELDTGQ